MAAELILYVGVRFFVILWEKSFKKHRAIQEKLENSKTHAEWHRNAVRMDRIRNLKSVSYRDDDHSYYDHELITSYADSLREAIKTKAVDDIVGILKAVCVPNLGGIDNEQIYSQNYQGSDEELSQFISLTTEALELLSTSRIPLAERKKIFKDLQKNFGSTALLLSGGASNGYYHLGVVKALLEKDILPNIISGSSAGALIGSYICTRTTEELKVELTPELHTLFTPCDESIYTILSRFVTHGHLFDTDHWISKLRDVTRGDTTFAEAFMISGRVLNISVYNGSSHSRLLNYKNSPHVVIWSAVLASAAVPKLLPAQQLRVKNPDKSISLYHKLGKFWKDGSFRDDLPFEGLHQQFRVQYTIVSQVEPHIVPFFFEHRGSAGQPSSHADGKGWRGGFLSAYMEHALKLDLKKWLMILRDFDLLPRVFGTDWSFVFLQRFWGCVTIVPKLNFMDYPNLVKDPGSCENFERYIRGGEVATWPKLAMIANRKAVEIGIELCCRYLSEADGSVHLNHFIYN
jgi:predicted acylesterase/phospholipase RssA